MLIKKIGEFGLINRISSKFSCSRHGVIVGIGDDCAILPPPKRRFQIATTDMLIEDVHFRLRTATPFQIGWKSLVASISDISAMGGEPTFAFISIGLPKTATVELVDGIYEGIKEASRIYSIDIVGGDTVSSPQVVINITLLGETDEYVLRSGAKPGDAILVTGDVGGASAGLEILEQGLPLEDTRKHLMPVPRLQEGKLLAKSGFLSAMIDISDGLASEIYHICEQSKTGAQIYKQLIPLSDNVLDVSKMTGKDPYSFALYGGEDYELLLTCDADKIEQLTHLFSASFNTRLTYIGKLTDDVGVITLEDENGTCVPIARQGYNHFSE